jgi:hypothetical protein
MVRPTVSMRSLLSLLVLLGIALSVASARADVAALRATRTAATITVDGALDEPAWLTAPEATALVQKRPVDGAVPTERTRVRVLYDDDALYIGFDCEQSNAELVTRLTRRDREVEADWVSIGLDTSRDGKTAFEFKVNAAGVLVDGIRSDDVKYSADWDENWEARTARTATGWVAELRIPLRILRFRELPVQSWGFQARRYISMRQEMDEWAYSPRTSAGEVSRYGQLTGLVNLKRPSQLELRPFVWGRLRSREASAERVASGLDAAASAGLDLKWHPTQRLTLDATFNPDFAQVEADQVVLNLTTYETFYQEKRPFFLEGNEAFATPFQLLYTRRIGRAGDPPELRAFAKYGERLVDDPQPATIYAADKLVGRLDDRWTIATLSAITAKNEVKVEMAGGRREKRVVDPMTTYNVLRLKRDLGDNAHIGILGTSVKTGESDYPIEGPDRPTGQTWQLCPSGIHTAPGARCGHDAYVAGIDGRWRSPSGAYAINAQAIASIMHGGPPRMLPDGTVVRPGDAAPGFRIEAMKEGGEHFVGEIDYEMAGRKLDYNDLGYMWRQNHHWVDTYVEYRTMNPWGRTLETHTGLEVMGENNLSDLTLSRQVYAYSEITFENFWRALLVLNYEAPHFDDREVGDGTALQRAGLVTAYARIRSDPRKAVSILAEPEAKILSRGVNLALKAEITFHVLPQLDLQLLPTASYTRGEPRYSGLGQAPGEYTFGKLEAKSAGATLRATYSFTPRLTLQSYAQLFVASAHYTDFTSFVSDPSAPRPAIRLSDLRPGATPETDPDYVEGALNVNVVLRWEYKLGSTLFVVYQRAQTPVGGSQYVRGADLAIDTIRRSPATDVFLIKLSYWWG